ncbi:transferase [Aspergillus tetrazonus]
MSFVSACQSTRSRREIEYLHPSPHPQMDLDEQFPLSPLDLVITRNYSTWALIFKLDQANDSLSITQTLRRAIQATLAQCRHVVGTIEADGHGGFCILKRIGSTVPFVTNHLDGPSYADIKQSGFSSASLVDPTQYTIPGMTLASPCSPDASPPVSGYQVAFIPGGFVFTVHVHHFAMDVTGINSLIQQIADHSRALVHGTTPPEWNDAWMDRSRFNPPSIPQTECVDAPPPAPRHLDWKPCSWLLFSIPQEKLTCLKHQATSLTTTTDKWISTYDALAAFLWRVLSRNRAKIYHPDLSAPAIFLESKLCSPVTPPIAPRYQGNLLCGGISSLHTSPLTLHEVITPTTPLSTLAAFIRDLTNSVTEDTLKTALTHTARIRDKSNLDMRLDSFPPMSVAVTDWRGADMCAVDFGFSSTGTGGRPTAARHVADTVLENMVMIYPTRMGEVDVVVPFEAEYLDLLLRDEELATMAVFRGVEATKE